MEYLKQFNHIYDSITFTRNGFIFQTMLTTSRYHKTPLNVIY